VRTLAALVAFTNWLPKASDDGDRPTGVTPVPLSCALCGLFEALSLTVSVPVRTPSAVGVKVAEILQLPPAASVAGAIGHVEVCPKSPETEMLLIASGAVVVLLRTMALDVLVVCTTQLPKLRLVGVRV
jgi:hypothetical protein